jgi:magnesium transporter
MDEIEHDIDEIEEELFGEDEGVSRRIFALQREVIDLRHATAPLPAIMDRLEHYVAGRNPSGEAPGYRDRRPRTLHRRSRRRSARRSTTPSRSTRRWSTSVATIR